MNSEDLTDVAERCKRAMESAEEACKDIAGGPQEWRVWTLLYGLPARFARAWLENRATVDILDESHWDDEDHETAMVVVRHCLSLGILATIVTQERPSGNGRSGCIRVKVPFGDWVYGTERARGPSVDTQALLMEIHAGIEKGYQDRKAQHQRTEDAALKEIRARCAHDAEVEKVAEAHKESVQALMRTLPSLMQGASERGDKETLLTMLYPDHPDYEGHLLAIQWALYALGMVGEQRGNEFYVYLPGREPREAVAEA